LIRERESRSQLALVVYKRVLPSKELETGEKKTTHRRHGQIGAPKEFPPRLVVDPPLPPPSATPAAAAAAALAALAPRLTP